MTPRTPTSGDTHVCEANVSGDQMNSGAAAV